MSGTYFIDTMGCQMNVRDSETIAGVLEEMGYVATGDLSQANVVVFNTCAVREKPVHKLFSKLGDVRKLKQRRPETLVVVAGCVAQMAHEDIRERAPYVDVVIGPRNLSALRDALAEAGGDVGRLVDDAEVIPEGLPAHRNETVNAFVNIMYGCNNFCAYCVVPYTRGREQSRSPEEVIAEVRAAAASGRPEVTLLGQNVNSYEGVTADDEAIDFSGLLAMVDGVQGVERLRFTTSHPKDTSPRLLDAMRDLPAVCEHLHLPIQSGDDQVLESMGRGYTYAHYRDIVQAARGRMPQIAITTDVMVGFPGETEEQFENTLRAFEELRYDQAFMFIYSDRPGTRAENFPDKIPHDVKRRRLQRLVELQNSTSRQVNEALVGQELEVLVEGVDPKSPDSMRGRTRTNKLVVFPVPQPETDESAVRPGELVMVRAESAFLWGFIGQLIEPSTPSRR